MINQYYYGSLLQLITDRGQEIDDDLPGPVVSVLDDVLESIQLQACEWTCVKPHNNSAKSHNLSRY